MGVTKRRKVRRRRRNTRSGDEVNNDSRHGKHKVARGAKRRQTHKSPSPMDADVDDSEEEEDTTASEDASEKGSEMTESGSVPDSDLVGSAPKPPTLTPVQKPRIQLN